MVLQGDFGLGKSRCVKQIFDILSENVVDNPYVIAINLRDHWGAKRAGEILDRHFDDLGMDAKNFTKSFEQSNVIYLLDGFDEIVTQSWSTDVRRMKHNREMSTCALKDLISKTKGGILITGREYYFNSDKELLSCLGLSEKDTVFLECHQEFTEDELLAFMNQNLPDTLEKQGHEKLPAWLPKRPLVIQLLLKYADEVFTVDYALEDICGFWYALLQKICEREAKIYPALNPDVIKTVLIHLANHTRTCINDTGPITQNDLSNAFVAATGVTPTDDTTVILQRLPSLGRVNADSPDRQFLDTFILNGLRAESIIQLSQSWDTATLSADWKRPLDQTGLSILSEYISKDSHRFGTFLQMARRAAEAGNKVLASDVVAAMCLLDMDSIDFNNLMISDGYFSHLSFEGKEIRRLSISDSFIERLDLTNSNISDGVQFSGCIISTVYGIASHNSIPEEIQNCDIESCEALATTTLIKKARLSESQKLFVEMIRKIFFQPGAGRKEAALLRGMGVSANKPLGEKILRKLLEDKIIERHKGDEGYVYTPVHNEKGRIEKLVTDLTLSKDPLWEKISALS